jgi:predicted nucleic acid-binding protein
VTFAGTFAGPDTAPGRPVVLDASVAQAVLDADGGAGDALERWAAELRLILVPVVFWIEVANVLVRRRRVPAADAAGDIADLRVAGIEVADGGFEGLTAAIALADRHGLTVYDATYLWLAMDVDGELATFDQALGRAATAEGVPLSFRA